MNRSGIVWALKQVQECKGGGDNLCESCRNSLAKAIEAVSLRAPPKDFAADLKFLRKELAKHRALLRTLFWYAKPGGMSLEELPVAVRKTIAKHNHLAAHRLASHRKAVRK